MNAMSRLRIIIGIIATIAIVVLAFMYLNYTMSRATSYEARLEADTYAVSIDYAGIVEERFIDVGSKVKEGDKLLEIRSSQLAEALNTGSIRRDELLFELADNGNIVLKAHADGTVREVNYFEGSYVPAGATLVTVDLSNSLYVTSVYRLKAPDYARINRDNPVAITLPDNQKLQGDVFDVTLQNREGEVETIVKSRIPQDKVNTVAFSSGTPVETTWRLDDNDLYRGIMKIINKLFSPSGGA